MIEEDKEFEKIELRIQEIITKTSSLSTPPKIQTIVNLLIIQSELFLILFRRYKIRADETINLTGELIKLSKAAENQAEKLIDLTDILKRYTKRLLILTVILVLIGVVPIYIMLNEKPDIITNNYTTNTCVNNTDTTKTIQKKDTTGRIKINTQNNTNKIK